MKKFIFLIFVLISSNANAEKAEDLIGKNLWLAWEEWDLECNYTFFEWNEFSSDCSTEEYVVFKIKNFSDNGQSYMSLDPYDSGGNTVSHFFYFQDESDILVNAWKFGDAEYSYQEPYWDLEEIEYSGSNLIKKQGYDYHIAFIDFLLSIDPSEEDISTYNTCKQNIPEEWLVADPNPTNATFESAMEELPKFVKLLQKQKNMEAFEVFMSTLFEDAASGKNIDDYDIPKKFRKIKKENFYRYAGDFFGVAMGCAFASMNMDF